MQLNKSIAVGDYVFFFRAGDAFTIPTAGTCSASAKPGSADTGWINTGVVEKHEDKESGDKEEQVWAPQGQTGILTLKDVIQTKQGLELDFTVSEVTPLAVQAMYRTGKLDNTVTQFNPLSAPPPKGWLKIQRYDQDGTAHLVMDVYGRLKVKGGMSGGDGSLIKPQFNVLVLQSALNTAAI